MVYPEFVRENDTIGVTAPSDGNHKEMDYARVDLAVKHFKDRGILVKETANVRTSEAGRSSSAKERCSQLLSLIKDENVKAIITAKGGDFLMEMLPDFDFEEIRRHPTWIQGYSDNTGLVFPVTVLCDVASIYGGGFNDFAMEPWHSSVENAWQILQGNMVVQESFSEFEDGFFDKENPGDGYHFTTPVCWQNLIGGERVQMEGRLIGGCLDVLLNLVGTPFGDMSGFLDKYSGEGIIWYLESFALDTESVARGLWQLTQAGWFRGARGFIFGRPAMCNSFTGMTYADALRLILKPFGVPVVMDADIGHKGPQFSIINGAWGQIESADGKGSLRMELR